MLQLVRIESGAPVGFDALRAEADAEGHRHMNRLSQELASGETRFEPLLAAYLEGELVAVGGLTVEPGQAGALRMRRLFVSRRARRSGVATTLVNALLQEAFDRTGLVTVHAGALEAAAFWETVGFTLATGEAWSHELRRAAYSAA